MATVEPCWSSASGDGSMSADAEIVVAMTFWRCSSRATRVASSTAQSSPFQPSSQRHCATQESSSQEQVPAEEEYLGATSRGWLALGLGNADKKEG